MDSMIPFRKTFELKNKSLEKSLYNGLKTGSYFDSNSILKRYLENQRIASIFWSAFNLKNII